MAGALGLLLAAACGGQAPAPTATLTQEPLPSVRGVVLEVEATSITELKSLAIQDEAGKRWAFRGEGFVGMTPSHLREHAVTGAPVTVSYRMAADGALAAVQVRD